MDILASTVAVKPCYGLLAQGSGGYRGISLEALDFERVRHVIYVERFTSALYDSDLQGLSSILGKEVMPVQRWFVEDGREIMEIAKRNEIAFVTYGDPLIATTHNELPLKGGQKLCKDGSAPFCLGHLLHNRRDWIACLQVWQDSDNDVRTAVCSQRL